MDRTASAVTYAELLAQMPSALRSALVCEPWRIDKLWQLDGRRFRVSPRAVLAAPERYPHPVRRIDAIDLAYQIHVMWRHERWIILDGFHRIAELVRLGRPEIAAYLLADSDLANICRR